jgi:hypothetical protein
MKMQSYRCFIVAALFLLIPKSIAFADQAVTLGSGTSIQIIAVGPIQFSQGSSALMLKYKTAIPLSDMASLRKEANEIWDRFQVDVEHAGNQQAIISANEPEDGGLISHSQGYNFIFEKKDGSWRLLEGDGKNPIKLDENFVKEFCDRMDWAYEHNEMNAFLLYLANNYSGTFTEGTAAPQTADRMKLAAMTYQTLKATKNYQYQRKILKIQIDSTGTSAQVESQETEQGTVNGHDMNLVEHSIDTIEVQGNSVVVTKTTTSMEDQSKKN